MRALVTRIGEFVDISSAADPAHAQRGAIYRSCGPAGLSFTRR